MLIKEAESKTHPEILHAYFMLEDKLENRDFEYLSYWLAKYASHPDKISFSPINLNDYRSEIITDMLYSIRYYRTDDEVNMDEDDLLPMVAGARKLGAKWYELDIMERSLRADKNK